MSLSNIETGGHFAADYYKEEAHRLEREVKELRERLSTAYRVKAKCNDEAIFERHHRLAAERKVAELEAKLKIASESREFWRNAATEENTKLIAAEADKARLSGLIQWAHDTLYEINVSNYDHEEVCRLNDASVEVILGLAEILGKKHGKTDEWWAEYKKTHPPARAALSGSGSGWPVPDGWKLVPVEPDDAMIEAGQDTCEEKNSWGGRVYASDIWESMLAASPAAPQQGGE